MEAVARWVDALCDCILWRNRALTDAAGVGSAGPGSFGCTHHRVCTRCGGGLYSLARSSYPAEAIHSSTQPGPFGSRLLVASRLARLSLQCNRCGLFATH